MIFLAAGCQKNLSGIGKKSKRVIQILSKSDIGNYSAQILYFVTPRNRETSSKADKRL